MSSYNICSQCVMDTTDPDIVFDNQNICNHCHQYLKLRNINYLNSTAKFDGIISYIRKRGKSYSYDCIVAFSGGTDSSFMLHKLKDCGLRVLAVHYNSGWNSEEATFNIRTMTAKIGVDLYEYTVDFNEFRALQIAYLKAGVVDMDVPTDHALHGSLYQVAIEKKVPIILTGHNFETESVMPLSWVTDKLDSRNLRDIYKQFGEGTTLKKFPIQTLWRKFYQYNVKRIEMIFILNYLDYNKELAALEMKKLYDWERVKVKHGESIWTRFYQCYILPKKFGIDKRRAHFSNLILSGVINRDEALKELELPLYKNDFNKDKELIFEKYKIHYLDFEKWMNQPNRKHADFKNEKWLKESYALLKKIIPWFKISTRH